MGSHFTAENAEIFKEKRCRFSQQEFFPVLFAIPRTAGWLAQWVELLNDPDQKIGRPRQIYLGAGERNFVPMEARR